MKIAVISSHRVKTLPKSASGLANSLYEIAKGLTIRGHDVTMYVMPDSDIDLPSIEYDNPLTLTSLSALQPTTLAYDVILSGSHSHSLSRQYMDLPVLNRMGDRECKWKPPNSVVATQWMQIVHPRAKLIRTGVYDDISPALFSMPRTHDYMAFMGSEAHKGLSVAERVCELVDGATLRTGVDLYGAEKWEFLYHARALLHPSVLDAAPRLPLEAAMVGTPTITLSYDGAQEHVENGVSGYVCEDMIQMADCLQMILDHDFNGEPARAWVATAHNYDTMISGYEALLKKVAEGERWR